MVRYDYQKENQINGRKIWKIFRLSWASDVCFAFYAVGILYCLIGSEMMHAMLFVCWFVHGRFNYHENKAEIEKIAGCKIGVL